METNFGPKNKYQKLFDYFQNLTQLTLKRKNKFLKVLLYQMAKRKSELNLEENEKKRPKILSRKPQKSSLLLQLELDDEDHPEYPTPTHKICENQRVGKRVVSSRLVRNPILDCLFTNTGLDAENDDVVEEKILSSRVQVKIENTNEETLPRKIQVKTEDDDTIEEKIRPPKTQLKIEDDIIEEKIRPPKTQVKIEDDTLEEKIRPALIKNDISTENVLPLKAENDTIKEKISLNTNAFLKSNCTVEVKADTSLLGKYIPKKPSDIFDNKAAFVTMQRWLQDFQSKKIGTPPALILHGSPGIGKTSSAHVLFKSNGYDVREFNSSSERGKDIVDNAIKNSIFFKSLGKPVAIIIDEVDGMDGHNGVSALCKLFKSIGESSIPQNGKKAKLVKQPRTSVPIICTCNELYSKKLFNLRALCKVIEFKKPSERSQEDFILKIFNSEGFKLVRGAEKYIRKNCQGSDFRQLMIFIEQLLVIFKKKNSKIISDQDVKDLIVSRVDLRSNSIFLDTNEILSGNIVRNYKGPSSDQETPIEKTTRLMSADSFLVKNMLQHNYLKHMPKARNPKAEHTILEMAAKIADDFSSIDGMVEQGFGNHNDYLLGSLVSCTLSSNIKDSIKESSRCEKPAYDIMYTPNFKKKYLEVSPSLRKSVDDLGLIRHILEDENKFKDTESRKKFAEFCSHYKLTLQDFENIDKLTHFESSKKMQKGSGKNSLKNLAYDFE